MPVAKDDVAGNAPPGSEASKQELFDRQYGEAVTPEIQDSKAPAIADSVAVDETEPDSADFPDTLQANLPEAWQTTAIWPTFEESMLDGTLPVDLPPEVGERNYHSKKKTKPSEPNRPSADRKPNDPVSEPKTTAPRPSTPKPKESTHTDRQVGARHADPSDAAENRDQIDNAAPIPPTDRDPKPVTPYADATALASSEQTSSSEPVNDEEDAIDFFGQTSKPVFDFDLPTAQCLAGGCWPDYPVRPANGHWRARYAGCDVPTR